MVHKSCRISWLTCLPRTFTLAQDSDRPIWIPRSGKSISLAHKLIILSHLTVWTRRSPLRRRTERGQKVVTGVYIKEFDFHACDRGFLIRLPSGSIQFGPLCRPFRSKLQFLSTLRDYLYFPPFPTDRTPDCRLIVRLLKGAVRRYAHI